MTGLPGSSLAAAQDSTATMSSKCHLEAGEVCSKGFMADYILRRNLRQTESSSSKERGNIFRPGMAAQNAVTCERQEDLNDCRREMSAKASIKGEKGDISYIPLKCKFG